MGRITAAGLPDVCDLEDRIRPDLVNPAEIWGKGTMLVIVGSVFNSKTELGVWASNLRNIVTANDANTSAGTASFSSDDDFEPVCRVTIKNPGTQLVRGLLHGLGLMLFEGGRLSHEPPPGVTSTTVKTLHLDLSVIHYRLLFHVTDSPVPDHFRLLPKFLQEEVRLRRRLRKRWKRSRFPVDVLRLHPDAR
ncbi:hypothetical protein J6590_052738 [Homalodisca vitripennis]|nr:hypothetical protein J6590_052738 [Homalodisca vitripennis]